MANYQNHVIDPTFFYDAIEEFSFDFDIYVVTSRTYDEFGNEKYVYNNNATKPWTIRGSLQTKGSSLKQSLTGNTNGWDYNFYCKSLYRIDIGDIIEYKGKFLRVNSVHDYDEFGCRSCSLSMIDLTAYRDLSAYVKYLTGVELV